MNKTLLTLCAVGSLAIFQIGCVAPQAADPDEPAAAEDVGEATQAISYNDWNYTCASTLSMRDSPGGSPNGIILTYGTIVHAYYPPSGAWANVQVCPWGWSGPCSGARGWVLKDYVSQSC